VIEAARPTPALAGSILAGCAGGPRRGSYPTLIGNAGRGSLRFVWGLAGPKERFDGVGATHGPTTVYTLMGSASRGWRLLNGSLLLAEVVKGVVLIDGIREKPAA
jgi:hypothetical protein